MHSSRALQTPMATRWHSPLPTCRAGSPSTPAPDGWRHGTRGLGRNVLRNRRHCHRRQGVCLAAGVLDRRHEAPTNRRPRSPARRRPASWPGRVLVPSHPRRTPTATRSRPRRQQAGMALVQLQDRTSCRQPSELHVGTYSNIRITVTDGKSPRRCRRSRSRLSPPRA